MHSLLVSALEKLVIKRDKYEMIQRGVIWVKNDATGLGLVIAIDVLLMNGFRPILRIYVIRLINAAEILFFFHSIPLAE